MRARKRAMLFSNATTLPRAASSSSGVKLLTTITSASRRTITSAGDSSGATVFSSQGGVSSLGFDERRVRREQLPLDSRQPAVEEEEKTALDGPPLATS